MSETSTIAFTLGASSLLLIVKLLRGGLKDLITPLALFYFYFAFGPIINLLLGNSIYFGTPLEFVPKASWIFFTGIATLIIGSMIWPAPKSFPVELPRLNLNALTPVMCISILYALYVIVMLSLSGAQDKISKIAIAIPGLHYNYLLLQIYLVSFYFLIKDGFPRKLFYLNAMLYILYSFVIGERDYIFPVVSILFHRFLLRPPESRANVKLIAVMIGMLFLATGVFFLRDATQSSEGIIAAIMNQGSLLFVNTFSLKLLEERIDYFMGFTYFNSFLNLLPNWIYKTDFNTLEWFKNHYAAASTSGYGYGLDAEGFINFSFFGVFIVFFFILLLQRKIIKRLGTHPFFTYYSVFFTGFTMYSLRNDSLAFLKGNLYAIIFFFLIYKLSWKKENA